MNKKTWLILFVLIAGFILLGGCSSTEPAQSSRTNLKRKIQLKKHLNRLNKENQQLLQMLRDASLVNIETYQVLDSDFVTKERMPEFNKALERYKAISLDTQIALDTLENELRSDTQKNDTIVKLLDGIVPDNPDQQERKNRLTAFMQKGADQQAFANYDRVHIGIAAQGVRGNAVAKYNSIDSKGIYQGAGSSLYFTYVGEYNTLVSFQHSVFVAQEVDDESSSANGSQKDFIQSTINTMSIGGRVESIHSFNVLPQIVFGMGKTKFYSCESADCTPKDYGITDSRVIGFELPIYHQLSSVFSWGLKLSALNITSEDIHYYVNDRKSEVFEGSSSVLLGGLGLMIGAAW